MDGDDDDDNVSVDSSATSSSHNNSSNPMHAEQEIYRILANRRNYYRVLNLTPATTTNASVKKSYHKIARAIHPDKCKHPDASKAMSVVTAANSTLTTPKLKQSYDLYFWNTQDVSENATSGQILTSGTRNPSSRGWFTSVVGESVVDTSFRRAFVMLLMIFWPNLRAALIALFLAYMCVHMVFWVLCCCGCCGHCWPRYGEGARIHEIRQRRFFAMLRDYEQAQMYAAQRGDPDPDPERSSKDGTPLHPEDLSFPDGYDREFTKGHASSYGATDDFDDDAYRRSFV